ncbi:MAG: type IV pilin protein [Steroidobacteraceae bacterium]
MNTCAAKLMGRSRGFTLVELMVTVVVGAILVTIAVSTYTNQVRKSRRTEAKTAVLDLAGREERNYSTSNAYVAVPASLGYTGGAFPIAVGSGYYNVNVAVVAAAPGVPAAFTITATPIGAQANDTGCASFTVTDQGVQSALDSGGADATIACWR